MTSQLAGGQPGDASPGTGRRAVGPRAAPRARQALGRGLRRRCPHCGVGPLFERWITALDRCPACGLVYLPNPGDTWFFWILGDRIPIAIGIACIYFGFRVTGWLTGLAFLLAMVVPLIATMPHRQGLAIALNYLSRVHLPDPSDRLPSSDPMPPGSP